MKRALIAITLIASVFAIGVTVSAAEEQPQAAPQAAPATSADKAVETTGGCMPGGGCCGQGACAQAAAPDKGAAADGTGGCPCMKNMKKKNKKMP